MLRQVKETQTYLDVPACLRCGGRMSLIAAIDEPRVVRKLLSHLILPTERPLPRSSPPAANSKRLLVGLPV